MVANNAGSEPSLLPLVVFVVCAAVLALVMVALFRRRARRRVAASVAAPTVEDPVGAVAPKPRRSRFASLKQGVLLLVAIGGVVLSLSKLWHNGERIVRGAGEMAGASVPAMLRCGDPEAIATLKTLFKEHGNTVVTQVENAREQPGATANQTSCVATLTADDGSRGNVAYRIERREQQFAVVIVGEAP